MLSYILVDCGNHYQSIDPKPVHTGMIEIKDYVGPNKVVNFFFSVPKTYNPAQRWPFIVVLHGKDSNAADFLDVWRPVADSLGFVLLAPQGEELAQWELSYNWGKNAERSILKCMDVIKKHVNIDSQRVYLVGSSTGGELTYKIGFEYPKIFRGLASFGPSLKGEYIPTATKSISRLRLFIGVGKLEDEDWSETSFSVNILKKAGLNITYKEYENLEANLPNLKKEQLEQVLMFLDERI